METNNPPNAGIFDKKPAVRNNRRFPKRKSYKKAVGSTSTSEDDIKAFKCLYACFFLIFVATALKDMFDNQNAE